MDEEGGRCDEGLREGGREGGREGANEGECQWLWERRTRGGGL